MNNVTLQKLLENNKTTRKNFHGVYAIDRLPEIPKERKKKLFFIVNLSPSYESGSHWVGVMLNTKKKKNIFFDSYGGNNSVNNILHEFLEGKYVYSKKRVQHYMTTVCGQWCMFFIWEMCRGSSLNEMLHPFCKKHYLVNDHWINTIISKHFKTEENVINREFLFEQIALSQRDAKSLLRYQDPYT